MAGIIFGLFSVAWISFVSMLYHVRAAKESVPGPAINLRKKAGQMGTMSALSLAAAIVLNYM